MPECLCCVCHQEDGPPAGQNELRRENTWLKKAVMSYGAVRGHVKVSLFHTIPDESMFVFLRLRLGLHSHGADTKI